MRAERAREREEALWTQARPPSPWCFAPVPLPHGRERMVAGMIVHPSPDAMAHAVADEVEHAIAAGLAARGCALIAVAGGSTPEAAARMLFDRPLDWAHVTLTVGDDRWVDIDDELSNAGNLLAWVQDSAAAAPARVVQLVAAHLDLHEDADLANREFAKLGQFDLVWAGMGGDGHVLSWFPGADLAAALDPASKRTVVAVTPDPLPEEAPVARLTLTLAAVAKARARLLMASGDQKRVVLDAPGAHPVAHFLALDPSVHWSPA